MKGISIKTNNQLEIGEYPVPEASGDDVVIKVKYCGICGSDRSFWKTAYFTGVIIGHEVVGTISDAGNSEFKVGERVVVIGYDSCGECCFCKNGENNLCLHGGFTLGLVKNGGYAEYVKVHKNTVRRLPDELSDIEGAIVEPAAVAFHTLTLSGVDENSRVLITGAGAIGIMAAAGAKALGAAFVGTTARNPARIEMAEKSSFVDYAFDGKDPDLLNKIQEVAGSITHVIECTGVDSMFNFAAEVVTKAGKIVIVAQPSGTFTYPATTLLTKEALVTPSLVYTPADFDMVIDFIKSGKMDIAYLVDSVIGFDAVQETFEAYETGEVAAIKILIDPSI